MKQFCAVIVWLLILAGTVGAQTLAGSAAISAVTGYQTNPYLDPVLNEWSSSYPRTFAAIVPAGGLAWSSEQSRVGMHLMGRLDEHPGHTVSSRLVRGVAYGSYELSPAWELGGQGGWRTLTHYQHSKSWWSLPYVRWKPSPDIRLDLQVGWTGRTSRDSVGDTASYNSGFGRLNGHYWATDRLRLEAGVHVSDSRAASGSMTFGGSGISSGLTYWVTNSVSMSLQTGVQYLRYEMNPRQAYDTTRTSTTSDPIDWQDLLLKGSGEVSWQAMQNVTIFARGRVMQANHSFTSDGRFDSHISAGVAVRLNRPLAEWTETTSGSAWHKTEDAMELQIQYSGDGQLFITGDFNDWASPGRPLRSVGDDRYSVKLSLPPGRYQYSIRVLDDEEECWLDLPEELRTVSDGFGTENGVLLVY